MHGLGLPTLLQLLGPCAHASSSVKHSRPPPLGAAPRGMSKGQAHVASERTAEPVAHRAGLRAHGAAALQAFAPSRHARLLLKQ